MADRICPTCGASAGPRLKFCRECGARVEDAPADSPDAAQGSEDATVMGALPSRPSVPAPTPVPAPVAGDGDATVLGALPTPAQGARPAAAPEEDLGRTVISTGVLPAVAPLPAEPPPGSGDETVFAGVRRAPAGASPAAPPSPPVPPQEPEPGPESGAEPEPEPVTDDFDVGDDDSGSTLAQATPPPPVPADLPAPAPAPAPASARSAVTASPLQAGRGEAAAAPPAPATPPGSFRLEHWSPKVKSGIVNLSGEETVVGRDRGDLKYPEDNYLSKKHARFYRDPEGRLCVEDLGALNGTFLRLRGPVKLEHRDVIFLGRHAFRFELLEYEEKDDRTLEGDPLTRVQGVQGTAPRARLVKRQEEGFRGLPFFFGVQRYVLGRTDGTHNFQRDDLMSRRHAALFHKDDGYWLEDLGSQNGTFLRLRGPRPLEAGDVVKMGDQYFKLA